MLQDAVMAAVDFGLPLDRVCDMDLTSFNAATASMSRVRNRAYMMASHVARSAQAEGKDFKKWIKQFEEGELGARENNEEEFLNKFGKGV